MADQVAETVAVQVRVPDHKEQVEPAESLRQVTQGESEGVAFRTDNRVYQALPREEPPLGTLQNDIGETVFINVGKPDKSVRPVNHLRPKRDDRVKLVPEALHDPDLKVSLPGSKDERIGDAVTRKVLNANSQGEGGKHGIHWVDRRLRFALVEHADHLTQVVLPKAGDVGRIYGIGSADTPPNGELRSGIVVKNLAAIGAQAVVDRSEGITTPLPTRLDARPRANLQ